MSADGFDERFRKIEQVQAKTAEDLQLLTGKILELTDAVSSTELQIERTQAHLDSVIGEMHEGFNRLIVLNGRTNDLIELLTQLEVRNSQRMTAVEQRVDKIEEKDRNP